MPEVQVNPESASAAKKNIAEDTPESPGSNEVGADPAKKSSGKSRGALYVVIALAVVAGIFFWLRPSGSTNRGTGDAATETMLPLETFVVNLTGGGQRGYLRVGITLGLAHPLRKKEDAPIALLRDAIVSVLASAQSDQLLTSEGKQRLKAELLKALQEGAPDLGIENVYFTEFLVQM